MIDLNFKFSDFLSKDNLKKAVVKGSFKKFIAPLLLKGLVAAAPYIGAALVVILCVFIILGPIMNAVNNIGRIRGDVSHFMEKVGNFLTFRGFRTDEEDFFKRVDQHYEDYVNKGKVCLDMPLIFSTLYYPYDITYNEEIYNNFNYDLDEEESNFFALNDGNESEVYKIKDKKIRELMRNMVSIDEVIYQCKVVEVRDDFDTRKVKFSAEIDYSKEVTETVYEGAVFPTSQECGTPMNIIGGGYYSSPAKEYIYYLDYEKYNEYLKTQYIPDPSNRFDLPLNYLERDIERIIKDIHIRAELYYGILAAKRYVCGLSGGGGCENVYGSIPSDALSQMDSPVKGNYNITSCFGPRTAPFTGFHKGVDTAGFSDLNAYAIADGTVIARYGGASTSCYFSYLDPPCSKCTDGRGNYVIVEHNINGDKYIAKYYHLSSVSVGLGTVKRGKILGRIGTTGCSTGVHLHFEMERNGTLINPGNLFTGTVTGSNCTVSGINPLCGNLASSNFDCTGSVSIGTVPNSIKEAFIASSSKYNIEYELAMAIAIHETAYFKVMPGFNVGGLMDPATDWKKLQVFNSLQEGVDAYFNNLSVTYIKQGLNTISKIGCKYAPIGAANDPAGLNYYWIPAVTKYYNGLCALNPSFNCQHRDTALTCNPNCQ